MSYNILVPLDGSPKSESVFPLLQLMAAKTKVQVELLRCYEPVWDIYTVAPDFFSLQPYSGLQEEIPKAIQDYLDKRRSKLSGLVSAVQVRCGHAAVEILASAERPEIDMIVMASQGRRGLERWMLGGVAVKVLRGSEKPVLVMAGPKVMEPRLETILVALDGSPCSERAFDAASKLATALSAELVLYQAVQMSMSMPEPEPMMEEVERGLQNLAATCPGLRTRVRVYPTDGDPYIVERAAELGADLIVMGSHGHRGLRRLLMGSVAEQVVHQACFPVMIVH